MRMQDYLKSILPSILCPLVLILLIDAVLLSSTSLNKKLGDIIYLNVLLIVVLVSFFIYGYLRDRSKYGKLRKALDSKAVPDYLLPADNGFHSRLLRDLLQAKNSEAVDLIGAYKNGLDELNDYITQWVHEIKIPVSVLELMLENNDCLGSEDSRKFKTETGRIRFLINQVLYAGRAAHYQEDLHISEFILGKVVKEALKQNASFLMSKNVEVDIGKLDFNITNDEKWVTYIIEQILNNAGKYVRQDGRVEIYAEEDKKAVNLHIRDNGMGIPPTDIPRIFEKGFTGENGRKTVRSTGMGLYYSKKIAGKLGIDIRVHSTLDEYTEFVLVFYRLSDYLNVTKM